MQYALVDNLRMAAAPKLKGTCQACGGPTLAKCGKKIVWHWAHASRRHCDPWWENETDWHRSWKECFPESQREIVMFAPDGEKHVADVRAANGMTIEFQNSPMSPDELVSRETFYGNMVWIVNATLFAEQFSIMSPVPDPDSELGRDIVFSGGQSPGKLKPAPMAGLIYWLRSENPDPSGLVEVHPASDLQDDIFQAYTGHHMFHWVRPRTVWFGATSEVFFDFGDALLWRLCIYHKEHGVRAIQRVVKSDLVSRLGGNPFALPPLIGESPFHPQIAAQELQPLWTGGSVG